MVTTYRTLVYDYSDFYNEAMYGTKAGRKWGLWKVRPKLEKNTPLATLSYGLGLVSPLHIPVNGTKTV